MESEINKFKKIENKLLSDKEFVSKTKKGIYLTKSENLLNQKRYLKN